jgi:Tfp pilus assembly protein PilF
MPRSGAGRPGVRPIALLLAALAATAVTLGGCSSKPPAQKAGVEVQKGLAAHTAGDVEGALKHYEAALKADPKNTYALYNIGLIAQNKGDNTEAEKRYREVLAIDPSFTSALFNLAIVRTAGGDTAEAITLYRKVIAIEPNNANAHLNLGFALIDSGKKAEGDAELKKAVQLDPKLAARVPKPTASPGATGPSSSASATPSP